jgi:hypothetical protein
MSTRSTKAKDEPAAEPTEEKTKGTPEGKATMQRAKFITQARWGVGKDEITYEVRRPIAELVAEKPTTPLATDAAGYLILAAKWAGLDDPSGNEFNGEGTSGNMLNTLEQISLPELEPGDLVVFGGGEGHSVGVLSENDKGAWKVIVHGEGGPVERPLAEEAAEQPEPETYLRLISA